MVAVDSDAWVLRALSEMADASPPTLPHLPLHHKCPELYAEVESLRVENTLLAESSAHQKLISVLLRFFREQEHIENCPCGDEATHADCATIRDLMRQM